MGYDKWVSDYGKHKYRITEHDLEESWNAATRELANTIKDGMIETDRGVLLSDDAIARLVEVLK